MTCALVYVIFLLYLCRRNSRDNKKFLENTNLKSNNYEKIILFCCICAFLRQYVC